LGWVEKGWFENWFYVCDICCNVVYMVFISQLHMGRAVNDGRRYRRP
jgi:hypothetical protein